MSVYLEASALWAMYYGEPGGDRVVWVLDNFPSLTLEWTLLELGRAMSKRSNEGEITNAEAEELEIFILSDFRKLVGKKKVVLVKVSWPLVREAYTLIRPLNLYASDAAHLVAARLKKARVMLVDDFHLKRLSERVREPRILSITSPREEIKREVEGRG
ncbi:MAG: PIN domain-containing protein [Candidatus Lokiarchaeia archaeon]